MYLQKKVEFSKLPCGEQSEDVTPPRSVLRLTPSDSVCEPPLLSLISSSLLTTAD